MVLVVEDEPAQREVIAYNLQAEGYGVARAENGEEALMLVQENAPDLIVLDWMLPNVSGIVWSSNAAGVATVSTTGLVTAIGVGTATITATLDGLSATERRTMHALLGTVKQHLRLERTA